MPIIMVSIQKKFVSTVRITRDISSRILRCMLFHMNVIETIISINNNIFLRDNPMILISRISHQLFTIATVALVFRHTPNPNTISSFDTQFFKIEFDLNSNNSSRIRLNSNIYIRTRLSSNFLYSNSAEFKLSMNKLSSK